MEYNDKVESIKANMTGVRYAFHPASERIDNIATVLRKHYMRKKQAVDIEAVAGLAEQVDEDVRTFYGKTLYFGEVSIAIDWGMYGEYGEFTGLNADRLFRFVRSYAESPERADAERRVKALASVPEGRSTNAETGRKNWEAMCSYALKAYDEFCQSGSLPGTRREALGLAGALQVAQRHNEANVYSWLKSVGLVAVDAHTLGAEADTMKAVDKSMRRSRVSEPANEVVKITAYSMMLESFFRKVQETGFDFLARMKDVASMPESERRFWT